MTTTSIIHFPDELLLPTLSHALAGALVRDFFLSAPEWHNRESNPPLHTLPTIARLSGVCSLWRQLVYSILRRALSPAGSITSPLIDQFPSWDVYRHTLRQLQARLRELRRHELDLYRDTVNIAPAQHHHAPANPILALALPIGTPPSPTALPVPPAAQQTPPTNPLAPFGAVPGLATTLPPGPAPIVPAIGAGAAPVPQSPITTTTTTTTITNNSNSTPLFTVAELYARADVFRRTYRGSGEPQCRVNQSLSIRRDQGVAALTYIRRARALLSHLNIDELGMALDRVLQETEEDVALGLRACEWQETLERLCTFPPWGQQAACEVYGCLVEMERYVNARSLPLLQLSGLARAINDVCKAPHILPLLVGKELIDCRPKANNLSLDWMSLVLKFDGYF